MFHHQVQAKNLNFISYIHILFIQSVFISDCSDRVLGFHVGGLCLSVSLSVVSPSIRILFPDDNLSKH